MEKEDGFRICSHCGEEMIEGYCINGGEEYFCSEECLEATHTKEEITNMAIGADNSHSYWATWYKDEIKDNEC